MWDRLSSLRDQLGQPAWHQLLVSANQVGKTITIVTAEYFVTAITTERNDNVSSRCLTDKVGWDSRCISKRFIELAHKGGQDGLGIGLDNFLVVIGLAMPGHEAGIACFVELCIAKANRERFYGSMA